MNYPIAIALLLYSILIGYCQNNPFFGDMIQLASKQAHFFYDHHFKTILLPIEIDSGHPPFMGIYLAAIWQFARNLVVSHWAIFPFVYLIVVQAWRWVNYFFPKDIRIYVFFLLLSIPTLVAQISLVSPDVILLSFFLLALNSILYQQNKLKIIALLGLAIISTRGLMASIGLCLAEWILLYSQLHKQYPHKSTIKIINYVQLTLPYLPAWILAISFLLYHYYHTGWIGYHANSPWHPCFERSSLSDMLKNSLIFLWRLLDFGMVSVWIAAAYSLLRYYKSISTLPKPFRQLLCLSFALLLITLPTFLGYKNLNAHRYLLPIYWLTISIAAYIIHLTAMPYKRAILLACIVAFWHGHTWLYPKNIAQGWDATLAYLPYYELRKNMLQYIDQQGLDKQTIGATAFVGMATRFTDLDNDTSTIRNRNLNKHQYILYSNISNALNDAEMKQLYDGFSIAQSFENKGIQVVLFKAKKTE
jgi:hypothetical protein